MCAVHHMRARCSHTRYLMFSAVCIFHFEAVSALLINSQCNMLQILMSFYPFPGSLLGMYIWLFCCKFIKTYCNNRIFTKKGCCNKRFCLNYTILISDLIWCLFGANPTPNLCLSRRWCRRKGLGCLQNWLGWSVRGRRGCVSWHGRLLGLLPFHSRFQVSVFPSL